MADLHRVLLSQNTSWFNQTSTRLITLESVNVGNTTDGHLDMTANLTDYSQDSSVEQDDKHKRVIVLIISCQMVIGLAGWLVVYPVMMRSEELTSAAYKLIISLGVNDGLTLLCYLGNTVLSNQKESVMQRVLHVWFTTAIAPLWHSFEIHLLVVALNRVVCIIFPGFKDNLYAGWKAYVWIAICWAVFMASASIKVNFTIDVANPIECILIYGVLSEITESVIAPVLDCTVAGTVLLAYVAVAIKIRLISADSRSAKKKEIGISIQQCIVFVLYALTIVTWYFLATHMFGLMSPCTTYDSLAVLDVMNYITRPIIYLSFNSILRQEVLCELICSHQARVEGLHTDKMIAGQKDIPVLNTAHLHTQAHPQTNHRWKERAMGDITDEGQASQPPTADM